MPKHISCCSCYLHCTPFFPVVSSIILTIAEWFDEKLPSIKWLDVSTSKWILSSLEGVTGQLLSKDSTFHRKISSSPINIRASVMAFNNLIINFTSDSQTPPIHGLLGGLIFYEKWTPFFMISAVTFSLSVLFTADLSFFSAPIKFVPLSDRIFSAFPRQTIKRRSDRKNELLERSAAFSK